MMFEQPPDSAPADQSGKDNASDTQHAVVAKPSLLWPLLDPDPSYLVYGTPLTAAVLLRYRFLDGTDKQHRSVRSTIETARKPEGVSFITWEDCANVKFQEVQMNPAEIRITFQKEVKRNGVVDDWYWSAVGSDSMDPKLFLSHKASMKLAGLPDEYPPTDYHRGNILHEFGHALGLEHEHQSPTFEGVVNLNEEAIIKHYHGDEEDARRNVLDKVEEPTNYTRFDKHSIMVYTIDPDWQNTRWWQTSKRILGNHKLSELDQAFIRLMYPPDLSLSDNKEPFLEAMVTAGVDKRTAGLILSDSVESQGSVGVRLTAMRNRFNIWKDGLLLFKKPNKLFWRGIDPAALRQSGVDGVIGEVMQNKLFQGIAKNIVHRSREQHGIPTNVSLPGGMQNEVMNMLVALAMCQDIAHTVKYYDSQLRAESDVMPSSGHVSGREILTGQELPVKTDKQSDSTHETSITRGLVPVDPSVWIKTFWGPDPSVAKRLRTTIDFRKPRGEKTVTLNIFNDRKKVMLDLNKKSFGENLNFSDIYLEGNFHFYNPRGKPWVITEEKAKWSPEWIAFYHGEWKLENITAVFVVPSGSLVTRLVLPDRSAANEDFENVRWVEY